MSAPKPKTADAHGRLWGAKARDWSELQEPFFSSLYESVFDGAGLGAEMHYLGVGCGAGLASGLAAQRGAKVVGIDAAAEMLAIARERVPGGDFRLGDIESAIGDGQRLDQLEIDAPWTYPDHATALGAFAASSRGPQQAPDENACVGARRRMSRGVVR